jgi:hypothetical protein
MSNLLLFRRRHQTAQQFAREVRRLARDFEGTPADRRALVAYVVRRCEEPRFGSDERLVAELERILDGFLEPWYDEEERLRSERDPAEP